VGNHSIFAPLNIGIADTSRRTPDMLLYTFQNKASGAVVQTTDPGWGLITGKWDDIGKFKGPVLRGLAARAPYFTTAPRDSAAGATLDGSMLHVGRRLTWRKNRHLVFEDPYEPRGLTLIAALKPGGLVRRDNVKRAEVFSTVDLRRGAIVQPADIDLRVEAYTPGAATEVDSVRYHLTLSSLPRNEPVMLDAISLDAVEVEQMVADADLAALRPISANQVSLSRTHVVAGAFKAVADVVGRSPLVSQSRGAVLLGSTLSTALLDPARLASS
jgi:hypothetical protein